MRLLIRTGPHPFPGAQRGRQIRQRHFTPGGEQRDPFHDVPQFPDVAGPTVPQQRLACGLRQGGRRAVLGGSGAQELCGEGLDVLGPFPQRRNRTLEYVQPVVQIFAERPGLHHSGKIPVRRGNDAHIQPDGLIVPNPFDDLIFKETQQFGLRRSRQFPDFVKEQGAAVRQLEFARLIAHRSGKSPPHVPKHFGFEKVFRDRRAGYFHKRLVRTCRSSMDGPSQLGLARSRLAGQEHCGIARRDPLHNGLESLAFR